MNGTWIAGTSPPSCPHCGGAVERVVTTTHRLARSSGPIYTLSPAYREVTDRCNRCGAELSPPPTITILER